jgi:hypothetical protein
VTADEARGSLWSDLVNGLLDARTDPATARFDAELASAVAAGELSRRTAQRLRFWQRAAVSSADDHARTVVPAVLGVLETARSAAQAYVEHADATVDTADGSGSETDDLAGRDTDGGAPWGEAPTQQQARTVTAGPTRLEHHRRASTTDDQGASTLEEPAPRLFVADLRDVPGPINHA